MPVAPRALALCLLLSLSMLSGCALLDAAINDPDQAPGFDLDEVDMTQDMPDLDMAPDLAPDMPEMDMAPDLPPDMPADMDMAPEMDMAPDMPPPMPTCQVPAEGFASPPSVRPIAVGNDFTCAVKSGDVYCWGKNSRGQLGDGATRDKSLPRDIVLGIPEPAIALAAGSDHACALTIRREVYCWGLNWMGQLGNNERNPRPYINGQVDETPVSRRAVQTKNLCGVDKISAGENHTCALTTEGEVYCWGRNQWGQIGDGTETGTNNPGVALPQKVGGIDAQASALSVGENGACAVMKDTSVKCWGRNTLGEAGQNSANEKILIATDTAITSGATSVASGQDTACAGVIEPDVGARLQCWGLALGYDRLAMNPNPPPPSASATLHAVGADSGVTQIVLGGGAGFGCALFANQQVKCWGDNAARQLGDNNVLRSITPRTVMIDDNPLLATYIDADANGEHVCAVTPMNEVFCWGDNSEGELGRGTISREGQPRPAKVIDL